MVCSFVGLGISTAKWIGGVEGSLNFLNFFFSLFAKCCLYTGLQETPILPASPKPPILRAAIIFPFLGPKSEREKLPILSFSRSSERDLAPTQLRWANEAATR